MTCYRGSEFSGSTDRDEPYSNFLKEYQDTGKPLWILSPKVSNINEYYLPKYLTVFFKSIFSNTLLYRHFNLPWKI